MSHWNGIKMTPDLLWIRSVMNCECSYENLHNQNKAAPLFQKDRNAMMNCSSSLYPACKTETLTTLECLSFLPKQKTDRHRERMWRDGSETGITTRYLLHWLRKSNLIKNTHTHTHTTVHVVSSSLCWDDICDPSERHKKQTGLSKHQTKTSWSVITVP